MFKKALSMPLLKTIKPKSSFFNIFQKFRQKFKTKMNSTHHFYPILIPNTSYVKIVILFVGVSQNSKIKFDI